jgi:hypothetical protein
MTQASSSCPFRPWGMTPTCAMCQRFTKRWNRIRLRLSWSFVRLRDPLDLAVKAHEQEFHF